MKINKWSLLFLTFFLLPGCTATQDAQVLAGGSAVELRSFQTRVFDTTDMHVMMRAIIATLQDLDFIIDKADEDLGMVTGTKLKGYQVRMTVITRARGETQLAVRASALYNDKPIEDPLPYQDFFTALEKSLFLTGHQVD